LPVTAYAALAAALESLLLLLGDLWCHRKRARILSGGLRMLFHWVRHYGGKGQKSYLLRTRFCSCILPGAAAPDRQSLAINTLFKPKELYAVG